MLSAVGCHVPGRRIAGLDEEADREHHGSSPRTEPEATGAGHRQAQGILSVFHYLPLHLSEMGRSYGEMENRRFTEDISERLLRLPFFTRLTSEDQARVIESILEFHWRKTYNVKGKIWNHAVKLVPDKYGAERPKVGLCHEGEI